MDQPDDTATSRNVTENEQARLYEFNSDTKEPRFTFFEILVGFFAAVSAWGAVDCFVEIIASGKKLYMAYIYCAGFLLALSIQCINRLFKRKFDLAHALNVFT